MFQAMEQAAVSYFEKTGQQFRDISERQVSQLLLDTCVNGLREICNDVPDGDERTEFDSWMQDSFSDVIRYKKNQVLLFCSPQAIPRCFGSWD